MRIDIGTTKPYETKMFRLKSVDIKPGLNILVGCNGAGKTTLMRMIKDALKKDYSERIISFDNLVEGGSHSYGQLLMGGNIEELASRVCSSEGENIMLCLGDVARRIGAVSKKDSSSPIFVFLDAVDSGFSVDNIVALKEDLINFVCEQHGADVYFIAAANEYELARGERCWDVIGSREIYFKDYEDYRAFILGSLEKKNKRYS